MEKFVIRRKANGEFYFNFTDKSGKVIFSSYGYTRKTSCISGIEAVRRNSKDHTKFNCKKASNSEPYFNLKSSNGKIIGLSQVFEDKGSFDSGMESLKYKAQDALIEDESK